MLFLLLLFKFAAEYAFRNVQEIEQKLDMNETDQLLINAGSDIIAR
jgi:hypothetical protein